MNNEAEQKIRTTVNEEIHSDDEIDLLQLCLILINRKYLILGICLISLCLGAAIAFLTPAKNSYSTIIEIGALPERNTETGETFKRPLESSEMVLAKMTQRYIPLAQRQISEKKAGRILEVDVTIPKNSELIALVSRGQKADSELYKELHTDAVNSLLESHQNIVNLSKNEQHIKIDSATQKLNNLQDPRVYAIAEKALKLKLNALTAGLAEFDDQEKLYLSKKGQLSETQSLLRIQIKKIEESLALAFASQPKALSEAADETRAMTLLLINNQIQQSDNRLAALQERLNVGVESQRKELEKNIADNKRAKELQVAKIDELQSQLINLRVQSEREIASQKNVIALLQNKLSYIRESKILGLAVQSLRPVGKSKMIILVLSGALGLVSGIILALVVEFVITVRQRTREEML